MFCFSEISDDGASVDNFKEVIAQNSLTSSYALRGLDLEEVPSSPPLFLPRHLGTEQLGMNKGRAPVRALTSDFPGALLLKNLEAVPDFLP